MLFLSRCDVLKLKVLPQVVVWRIPCCPCLHFSSVIKVAVFPYDFFVGQNKTNQSNQWLLISVSPPGPWGGSFFMGLEVTLFAFPPISIIFPYIEKYHIYYIYAHMWTHMYVYTYVYMHMYVCMYIWECVIAAVNMWSSEDKLLEFSLWILSFLRPVGLGA